MQKLARFLFAVLLAFGVAAPAQQKAPPAAAETSVPAKIDSVAWMKGYWAGEGYGGTVETMMSAPKAGVMIGTFRHMKADGKPGFYEICAIEEHEGSLRFVVKHFHPNWVGWEEKDKALMFPLRRIAEREASFGALTFRLDGADVLAVDLTMRMKDGSTRTEALRFRKRAL